MVYFKKNLRAAPVTNPPCPVQIGDNRFFQNLKFLKMKKLILSLSLLFAAQFAFAQAPQQINYQAVIRDLDNQILVNTDVYLRFTLTQNGTTVAEETDKVKTTAHGIANTVVGDNPPGIFGINWFNGPVSFGLELSLDSISFEPVGNPQGFSSVPWALAAQTADKLASPISLANLAPTLVSGLWQVDSLGNIFRDSLMVGIGTSTPDHKLTVLANDPKAAISAANLGSGAAIEAFGQIGINAFGDEKGATVFGNTTGAEIQSLGTAIHATGSQTGIFAYSDFGNAIHAVGPTAGYFEGATYLNGYARAYADLEVEGKTWLNGELDVDKKSGF